MNKYLIVTLVVGICAFGVYVERTHDATVYPPQQKTLEQVSDDVGQPFAVHYSYFADKGWYENAFFAVGSTERMKETVYGGIVPHHLIVAPQIAAWYEGLQEQNVQTVVLIGPNHFNAGYANIITSRAAWETPYGRLKPNLPLIEMIATEAGVAVEEKPFENEHSITAHVAFIKRTWPEARIVPLIVKWGTPPEEIEKIVESVAHIPQDHNSPQPPLTGNREGVLAVASVDFSHHQPWWVADFHDELSIGVIESFDQERLFDLEVDSPGSLLFLMEYLERVGARRAIRQNHTHTVKLTGALESTENTTHFFEYFTRGTPVGEPTASVLFFPDMMLGRHVGELSKKAADPEYPFALLKGTENLFFRGFDLLVANLEGPITDFRATSQKSISFAFDPTVIDILKKYRFNAVSLANNHGNDQGKQGFEDTKRLLSGRGIKYFGNPVTENENDSVLVQEIAGKKIGFIGFNLTDHRVDNKNLTDIIASVRTHTDGVVVFPHWGAEYQRYPTAAQKAWAHLFVDAGADVVIGHHPHVVQIMEVYKEKPIFYSLGNFIFDQYFSKETQEGLGVGMVAKPHEMQYYLIPYTIPRSQPQPMLHSDRQKFLQKLADDSPLDESMKKAVESGRIVLPR